jgi:hypothetical protein
MGSKPKQVVKLLCIVSYVNSLSNEYHLTKGKLYDCDDRDTGFGFDEEGNANVQVYYHVMVNDRGQDLWYSGSFVRLLDEVRHERLNDILG